MDSNWIKIMKGFIKTTETGEVLFAPNFVISKDYELLSENHEDYTYPVDGWEWTESYEPQNEADNESII